MPLSERYKNRLVDIIGRMEADGVPEDHIRQFWKDYHKEHEVKSFIDQKIEEDPESVGAADLKTRRGLKEFGYEGFTNKQGRLDAHKYAQEAFKNYQIGGAASKGEAKYIQEQKEFQKYDKFRQAVGDFSVEDIDQFSPITAAWTTALEAATGAKAEDMKIGEFVMKPVEAINQFVLGTTRGVVQAQKYINPMVWWFPDDIKEGIDEFTKPTMLEKAIGYSRQKRQERLKSGASVDVLDDIMKEGAAISDMMANTAVDMVPNLVALRGITGAGYGKAGSVIKTLKQAAKFGAWRTIATEGTVEDRLKAGALATLYMSTPALSGTFGGWVEMMGKGKFLAESTRFLSDALLNMGVTQLFKESYIDRFQKAFKDNPNNITKALLQSIQTTGGDLLGDIGFSLFGDRYTNKPKPAAEAKGIQEKYAEEAKNTLETEPTPTVAPTDKTPSEVVIRQPEPFKLTQQDYDEAFAKGGDAEVDRIRQDGQRLNEVEPRLSELTEKIHKKYLEIEDIEGNPLVEAFDARDIGGPELAPGVKAKYDAKTISDAIDGLKKGKGSKKLREALTKEEYKELKSLVEERGKLAKGLTPTLQEKRKMEASLQAGKELIEERGYDIKPTDEKDVVEVVPKAIDEQRFGVEPVKEEVRDAQQMPKTQEEISQAAKEISEPVQQKGVLSPEEIAGVPNKDSVDPTSQIGLTHEQTALAREAMGMGPYEKIPYEIEERVAQSQREGYVEDALKIADDIIAKKRPIEDLEQYGLTLKYGELLKNRMKLDLQLLTEKEGKQDTARTQKEILDNEKDIKTLILASDIGGSAGGAGLRSRQMFLNVQKGTLEQMLSEARRAKNNRPLTADERERFVELQKKYDLLTQEMNKLYDEQGRQNAEDVKSWMENKPTKRAVNNLKKMADLKEYEAQVKKELAGLGDIGRVREAISGSVQISLEGANLIRKLAQIKMAQGATKFEDMMEKLRLDMPDVNDKTLLDSISGAMQSELSTVAKETKGAVKDLNYAWKRFEKIARIQSKIIDAEKGEAPVPTPSQKEVDAELKMHQDLLKELKRDRFQKHLDRKQRLAVMKRIKEYEGILEGTRAMPPKKQKPHIGDALQILRDQANVLAAEVRVDAKIQDLKEQLKTKNFKDVTPRQKKAITSERLEELKVKYRQLEVEKARAIYEMQPGGKRLASEALSTLKAMKATADMSALLNQAFIHTTNHPIEAAKVFFKNSLPAFLREKWSDTAMKDVLDTNRVVNVKGPNGEVVEVNAMKEYIKAGLKFYSHKEGLEFFTPNLFDKFDNWKPDSTFGKAAKFAMGWGGMKPAVWVTKAAERNMTVHINKVRQMEFDRFLQKNPDATAGEKQAYAEFLHQVTGEGTLPSGVNKVGRVLLFAPKFAISKPETLYRVLAPAGEGWFKGGYGDKEVAKQISDLRAEIKETKDLGRQEAIKAEINTLKTEQGGKYWNKARTQAAKELGNTVMRLTSAIGLASMLGADVGLDPNDSDFLKVKMGDRRIDLLGGYAQPLRVVAQLAMQFYLSALGRQDENKQDFTKTLYNFMRFKASVPINTSMTLLLGKNAVGAERGKIETFLRLGIPLALESAADDFFIEPTGEALPIKLGAAGASFFGGRTAFYKKGRKKKKSKKLSTELKLNPNDLKLSGSKLGIK